MRVFLIGISLGIAFLQFQLFGPKGNYQELQALQALKQSSQEDFDLLSQRNKMIALSLSSLQSNASFIEEKARQDLGWIKPNETFVYIHRITDENTH